MRVIQAFTIAIGALSTLAAAQSGTSEASISTPESTSIFYTTEYSTIKDCGPADCPAMTVVTSVIESVTSVCPLTESESASASTATTVMPSASSPAVSSTLASPESTGPDESETTVTLTSHTTRYVTAASTSTPVTWSQLVPAYSSYPGYTPSYSAGNQTANPVATSGSAASSLPAATESFIPYTGSAGRTGHITDLGLIVICGMAAGLHLCA